MDEYCSERSLYMNCLDEYRNSFLKYWTINDTKFVNSILNIIRKLFRYVCVMNRDLILAEMGEMVMCLPQIGRNVGDCLAPLAEKYTSLNQYNVLDFLINLSESDCLEYNSDANRVSDCIVHNVSKCETNISSVIEKLYWMIVEEFSCHRNPDEF